MMRVGDEGELGTSFFVVKRVERSVWSVMSGEWLLGKEGEALKVRRGCILGRGAGSRSCMRG